LQERIGASRLHANLAAESNVRVAERLKALATERGKEAARLRQQLARQQLEVVRGEVRNFDMPAHIIIIIIIFII